MFPKKIVTAQVDAGLPSHTNSIRTLKHLDSNPEAACIIAERANPMNDLSMLIQNMVMPGSIRDQPGFSNSFTLNGIPKSSKILYINEGDPRISGNLVAPSSALQGNEDHWYREKKGIGHQWHGTIYCGFARTGSCHHKG